MDKILVGVIVALGMMGLMLVLALFSGTLLWMIWPITMVTVFHLPALTWWQSVCLVWVAGILIKSSNTSTK